MSAADFATLMVPAIIIGLGAGVAAWAGERLIDWMERRYATQAGARHAQDQHPCQCAARPFDPAHAVAHLPDARSIERTRSGDLSPPTP